jgi:hypothetical protein
MVSEVALSLKFEPLTVMTNINLSPEDMSIVQSAAICALRSAYHTTVDEPLPGRIMALLKELATQESLADKRRSSQRFELQGRLAVACASPSKSATTNLARIARASSMVCIVGSHPVSNSNSAARASAVSGVLLSVDFGSCDIACILCH